MDLHAVLFHVEGDIGGVEEVVGEVLLDEVALVAAADDEVVDAVMGVDFEDVPQDRPAADFDHGLGTHHGLFAEPRAHSAGEDNCLHFSRLPLLGCSMSYGSRWIWLRW